MAKREFIIFLIFVFVMYASMIVIHYTPNAICLEHMGIACDITQGRN